MYLHDIGILIDKKPINEDSYLIYIFTKNNGLIKSVTTISKKTRGALLESNLIDIYLRSKSENKLGFTKCELLESYYSYVINDKFKLYSFKSLAYIITQAFKDRDPHPNFFNLLYKFCSSYKYKFNMEEYIKFELDILAESGYKLNLNSCIVTEETDNLCYVSPRSGNAVSYNAGLKYADKLLKLPKFLIGYQSNNNVKITKTKTINNTSQDIFDGVKLTSFFIERYIIHNTNQTSSLENIKNTNPRTFFLEKLIK